MLPDGGAWPGEATIVVPAGATGTVSALTVEPAKPGAQILADVTMTISPGSVITVQAAGPTADEPVLALPGGNDIAVFAGQRMTLSQPAAMSSRNASSCLRAKQQVSLDGSAKITFVGQAILKLPAGALVAAPGVDPANPAKKAVLPRTSVFRLPHGSAVVAAGMWTLLLASGLTLIGAGGELGILGVLAFKLAQASLLVRSICLTTTAVLGVVVLVYSAVSIRALADPAPGDALNASAGTSFLP
jgi:hypothetical protein